MAIDLEKLKAAALASINHDGSNYYSHAYNHTKESNPATVLELIERLEAAENQRDELESTLRMEETISFRRQMQEYAAQRDELLNALKKVKSVGHGVIPKHVWMTVEEAIASIKENEK